MLNKNATKPKISIIIITYKSADTIGACLKSIYNTDFNDFETIVVDSFTNHDKTIDIIRDLKLPHLKIIPLQKNVGYALGNNIAVPSALGEYFLFINPDIIVPPNFIQNFFNEFRDLEKNYQNRLILCPIIKNQKGLKHFYKGIINSFGFSFIPINYPRDLLKKDSIPTDFISGCCFLIHQDHFKELNCFDPTYFMYFEDVFLSLKAVTKNFALRVSNTNEILHLQENNFKLTHLKYYCVERNRLRTVLRLTNKPLHTLIALMLFEPIMIFQAILDKILPIRARIYLDLIKYYRRDKKNIIQKIDFGKYSPKMKGITNFIEFNVLHLLTYFDKVVNFFANIIHYLQQ